MIYKFKSKAAGDVIMLKPAGDHVLRIVGKEPGPRGIVTVAELPAAIAALEAAIRHEAQPPQDDRDEDEKGDKPAAERVSLRQRAWPLVEMMRRCHAGGHEIVWGV